jgi:hypothetical protein
MLASSFPICPISTISTNDVTCCISLFSQVPFIFTAIIVTSFDIEFVFYIFSHTVFNFNLNMIYLYFFLKSLTKIKHVIQSQFFTNIQMYFQITNKTRCIKIYVVMKASRNLLLCLTSVTSYTLKKLEL